ncbi:MAG: hypothetical protein RL518_90 [Pseudomonadota bacterium]|jgi:hypothetical protein
MKRYLVSLFFALSLLGCGGGDSPDFAGVWTGSYTSLQNDCPFDVRSDINPLFPMTVSIDQNSVYTVVAVDGSVATGGQGQGEDISFLAQASKFGNYGSISPYTCESVVAEVGYLSVGENAARVTMTYKFTNCSAPGTDNDEDNPVSCGAVYFGDATKNQ